MAAEVINRHCGSAHNIFFPVVRCSAIKAGQARHNQNYVALGEAVMARRFATVELSTAMVNIFPMPTLGRKRTGGFQMGATDERTLLPEVAISAIDPIRAQGCVTSKPKSSH